MASTKARADRRGEERKRARGVGIKVTVGKDEYEVYQGDLSALDTAELRRATGMSYLGLLRAARADFDIDLFAALIWLARRVNGERSLTFEEVAADLDYDSEFGSEDITETDPPDGTKELEQAGRVIEHGAASPEG